MKAIVCMTTDGSIGRNGDQLYYLSDDLKRFKKLTKYSTVIMGMNTWKALPVKPLPQRRNIILTRSLKEGFYEYIEGELVPDNSGYIEVINNINSDFIKNLNSNTWCIGGGVTYKNLLPYCDEIYITEVQEPGRDTDVKFPFLSIKEWNIIDTSEILTDSKSKVRYKYKIAKRV